MNELEKAALEYEKTLPHVGYKGMTAGDPVFTAMRNVWNSQDDSRLGKAVGRFVDLFSRHTTATFTHDDPEVIELRNALPAWTCFGENA